MLKLRKSHKMTLKKYRFWLHFAASCIGDTVQNDNENKRHIHYDCFDALFMKQRPVQK